MIGKSGFTEVVLFGTGGSLDHALSNLAERGVKVSYLADNNPNKHGQKICGIEVLKPQRIAATGLPVLIVSMWARDIAMQLRSLGVDQYADFSWISDFDRWTDHFKSGAFDDHSDSISRVVDLLGDSRSKAVFKGIIDFRKTMDPCFLLPAEYPDYFHPLVQPTIGDVIVDGGAWHGDSCIDFSRRLGGVCRIQAFEPDASNFAKLLESITAEHLENVVRPIPFGLWSKNDTLHFNVSAEHSMQFRVDNEAQVNGIKVDVQALDQFVADNSLEVHFIKMDIEGSESEALCGAWRLIKEQKPKLAICIYHRPHDLWEIPLLIKQLNPNYHLYIGHHSQNLFDTVVYAD